MLASVPDRFDVWNRISEVSLSHQSQFSLTWRSVVKRWSFNADSAESPESAFFILVSLVSLMNLRAEEVRRLPSEISALKS